MTDPVSHPDHYTAGGIETIDILKAKLTPEQFEGFLIGNILKYLTRARHKNGAEDLEKARWYLERLIESQPTWKDNAGRFADAEPEVKAAIQGMGGPYKPGPEGDYVDRFYEMSIT